MDAEINDNVELPELQLISIYILQKVHAFCRTGQHRDHRRGEGRQRLGGQLG
jgi:hypothetical protein